MHAFEKAHKDTMRIISSGRVLRDVVAHDGRVELATGSFLEGGGGWATVPLLVVDLDFEPDLDLKLVNRKQGTGN